MRLLFLLPTITMAFNAWLEGEAQSFWKGAGAITDAKALHSGILYSRHTKGLFVSTYNMGIFKKDKTDSTWHQVLSLPKDRPVISLYESKNGYLYAGGFGRIYRSDPAGEKWNEIPLNFTLVKGFAEDINGRLYLCSADSGGILRSDDNGLTWKQDVNGLPSKYVNNIASDPKGNVFCTVINDKTDIHGGLFALNSAANLWVKKNISVILDNTFYTVKVNSIQSVTVTPGGMIYLSLDGGIVNFEISGIFKNTVSGALAGSVWKRETWTDTTTSAITLQFDKLFATETGHFFAGRISASVPGVYAKMKYSPGWFECSAGLPPVARVKGYFTEVDDGTVLVTTDFSNRVYFTNESKPGKKPQEIRFQAPAPARLYESSELNASSSSGLPVNFKSMHPEKARTDGNRVYALGLGNAVIKAWTDGNDTLYYSESSRVLSVSKARNEIILEPLNNPAEGDSSLEVTARATSGEAVQLAVTTGNAWFEGNRIHFRGPGRIGFMATEPGNATYDAADTVWAELCITPEKPYITSDTLSGTLLLRSSSEDGNRWFLNNTRLEQEERTISPATAGIYTLQINIDGCLSPFSEPFAYSVTGINDPAQKGPFIAWPQPFQDKLFIGHIDSAPQTSMVATVIDCLGNTVITKKIKDEKPVILDTGQLLPGWYILQIEAGDKISRSKIIRN